MADKFREREPGLFDDMPRKIKWMIAGQVAVWLLIVSVVGFVAMHFISKVW